jgi:hypothetical protein
MLGRLARGKHYSLLRAFVNYGHKIAVNALFMKVVPIFDLYAINSANKKSLPELDSWPHPQTLA